MAFDDDGNLSITPPDPVYVSIAAGLLRTLLAAAAGVGLGWAAGVTGEQITMLATMITIVVTALWSAYQKIRAHRKRADAAITSAKRSAEATTRAGQPVAIAVIDPKKAP